MSTDLKRLLAYSTTENVGLIYARGRDAGCCCARTGEIRSGRRRTRSRRCCWRQPCRVQDDAVPGGRRGAARAPVNGTWTVSAVWSRGCRRTTAAFGVGALGAAALPVTCGFVGRVGVAAVADPRGRPGRMRRWPILMPVAVAVVALTAGLALLTFVKAYGMAFLARPRGPRPTLHGHEGGCAMRVAMLAGAAARRPDSGWRRGLVAAGWPRRRGRWHRARSVCWGRLPGVDALLDPVALATSGGAGAGPVLCGPCGLGAARPAPRSSTWRGAAGGPGLSPRMQYTATSYAEPLSAGLRRRLAAPSAILRSPMPRSRATWSSRFGTASRSTMSSRTGSIEPAGRAADRLGERRAGCRTAASTATWASRSSRWSRSWWW